MVAAAPNPIGGEKIRAIGVPVIDLTRKRVHVSELMVKACEEFGFFKVINHGVPEEVIKRMEGRAEDFFAGPAAAKQRAGPANPLGYGCKNIGFNGDAGEVEYLLLHANPLSVSQRSRAIEKDPMNFCSVVIDYIEAVRDLACEILELLAEGLKMEKRVLSSFIMDSENDSVFRLNHYPCSKEGITKERLDVSSQRVGFGEHSDPQILTLLRSNDVGGLQISPEDGVWVPIPPDPTAFCVNVGDALQALTNGRLMSVRHRAMSNSYKSRMSMMYFCAPPLHAYISPLPQMLSTHHPSLYRPFTWAEFKRAAYSLRLGDTRLDLFRADAIEEIK